MAKPNSYGICIYKIENGSIQLFMNRTSSVSSLNFFKGKSEKNETLIDTALREMEEETSILISSHILEGFFEQKNKRKNIGVFLVDFNLIDFSQLSLDFNEIYSYEWVEILSDPNKISKNQRDIFLHISSFLIQKLRWTKTISI